MSERPLLNVYVFVCVSIFPFIGHIDDFTIFVFHAVNTQSKLDKNDVRVNSSDNTKAIHEFVFFFLYVYEYKEACI